VSVSVNPSGLAQGTYSGVVTVGSASAASLDVFVTLTVSSGATISATPAGLVFNYNIGTTVPPAQAISIGSSNPNSGVTFNASTSGQLWLSATLGSGTLGAATPGSVNVSVNPNGLVAGTYNGAVAITAASATNSPLTVPVTLTVTGVPPTISATPASLAFNYSVGGSVVPAQTISVGSSNPTSGVSFSASTSGGSWLSASPGSGTTPGSVSVSVNPSGLTAGTYKGAVNLVASGASNSPQAVNVTLTITASPALTVQKTHSGVFSQGQAGSYTITVTNSSTGGPTSGTVSVTDTLPAGLALVSMAGPGWSCVGTTCTRGDPLAPGSTYPSITANVNVASTAPSQVTNQATASGGGSALATADDVTNIAASSLPVISSVANAAGEGNAVAQNTWIEIKGLNLSPDTRTWQTSDFVNNQLPVRLDGVGVTVNGYSAYVYYISPTQVNVLTPLDSTLGSVPVQLTNNGSTSAAFTIQLQSYAPGLFEFSGSSYVAATHANGSLLGPASLYPGSTTPANPGEVITLYGNGFGQTLPPLVSGSETQTGILPTLPVVMIGGAAAAVQFAGVVAPGLYQLNVFVPATISAGDATVVATLNSVTSNTAMLSVGAPSSTGSLQISIAGLPNGVAGNVSITSSADFSAVVTTDETLQLVPGSYTIVANSIPAGSVSYGAFPVQQSVNVLAGGVSPVQVSYSAVIPNTTMVLDQQGIQGLSISADGSTLTIPAGSQVAQSLAPGSVLAVGVTPSTPNGLLSKIVSVSQTGSQIVAQTTQATLPDAFQQANFTFNTTFSSQSPQALQALRPGVTVSRRALPKRLLSLANPRDSLQIPCSSDTSVVVQMFDTPIVDDPNGTITVSGEIQICPSFEFDWKIGVLPPGLQSLTATATLGEDIQVNVSGSYQNGFNQTVDVATIVSDPITVFVGVVPIVLTPSLTLFVGASGSVNAGFSTGVTQAASVMGGISYANGQASPVFTKTASFDQDPLALDASATVKADAGVTIALNIEGVLSPQFSPDAYVQLAADLAANPWWTLSAGLEGDAAVKVGIFGLSKDFDFPGLFDFSTPIAQASGSFTGSGAAPVLSSISPTTALAGAAAITLTLNGSNFVPGATAYFNGTALATTYVSTQQLTAILPANSLSTAGTYAVTAKNPDAAGLSAAQSFVVQAVVVPNPTPTISSLSPNSTNAGAQALAVTIAGSGFIASSSVTFNGLLHAATFSSASQLSITLSSSDLATAGTFPVVVTNPSPGGGSSQPFNFTVTPASVTTGTIQAATNLSAATFTISGPATYSGSGTTWTQTNAPVGAYTITFGAVSGYTAPAAQTQILVAGGTISFTGTYTTASTGTVTITEFPVPTAGGEPLGITAGPDGNLWYTEDDLSNIGRITTTGTITGFRVPTAASLPYGITAGPDGNLWFAEQDGNNIGRITTSGTITEFPVPTANSGPYGITAGPDGNLWFTEEFGNKIGRITTSGTVTEFPVLTAYSEPEGITAGPDGNLWFTEYYGNIGRATTSGTVTEFPLPTGDGEPIGITAGPDGNLWFTEQGGNNIGRITLSGTVTEFPVLTAYSEPTGITEGPDGNLWFTEQGGNNIGRITTSGAITEFQVPTANSDPVWITAGPDGNLWFTEYVGNNIGRVATRSSTPTLQGLSLTVTTLTAGASTTGSVALSGAAPSGGMQVSLSSNNSCAEVPATVSIPAGQSSATFTITTTAVTSTQTVTITATLGTIQEDVNLTVTPASGGISVQGKTFTINGTINMGGMALGFEIGVVPQAGGPDFVELDNDISAASGIQFLEEFDSGVSVSGNTAVFSGSSVAGFYSDLNTDYGMPISITSTTLTIKFASSASGSAVTGTVSFSTSSGTIQGTFTGTLASPGFS
jgi:uncharacterized protein (TIGR03437 family)